MTALLDLNQLDIELPPITPSELFPGADGVQLTIWVSGSGHRVLREAAKDLHLSQSEIARRALAAFLATWQAERRRKLALLHGLTEAQVAQAKEIFDHLPESEIPAGERVHFDINPNEDVLLVIESTGARYTLFKGCAVKMELKDAAHSHLTLFRHKQVVEEGDYPLKPEGAT